MKKMFYEKKELIREIVLVALIIICSGQALYNGYLNIQIREARIEGIQEGRKYVEEYMQETILKRYSAGKYHLSDPYSGIFTQ